MTQDAVWDTHNVIRLAKQAKIGTNAWFGFVIYNTTGLKQLEAFAKLVAAHEREACACECEKDAFVEQWKGLAEATKRIRARGETTSRDSND
jgi:hypothetical protein